GHAAIVEQWNGRGAVQENPPDLVAPLLIISSENDGLISRFPTCKSEKVAGPGKPLRVRAVRINNVEKSLRVLAVGIKKLLPIVRPLQGFQALAAAREFERVRTGDIGDP